MLVPVRFQKEVKVKQAVPELGSLGRNRRVRNGFRATKTGHREAFARARLPPRSAR